MKIWNDIKKGLPGEYENVYVKTDDGKEIICHVIYVDDIDKYIWMDMFSNTYSIETFKMWRKMKNRKIINFKNKIKNKYNSIFKKKYWILTCITEDLDIFSQAMFSTYDDAFDNMTSQYKSMRTTLNDSIVQDDIFKESATVVYDDATACFEWKITCIEK